VRLLRLCVSAAGHGGCGQPTLRLRPGCLRLALSPARDLRDAGDAGDGLLPYLSAWRVCAPGAGHWSAPGTWGARLGLRSLIRLVLRSDLPKLTSTRRSSSA
jgi:hypothetical protein